MGRNRLTFPLLCPLLLLIVTLIQLADTGVQHTSEGKHGKQKKAHGGVASILHAAGMEVRKRAKKKTAESDAKRMKKKQKLKQQKMRLGMKRHHGAEADSGLVSIFRRGNSRLAIRLQYIWMKLFRDFQLGCETPARGLRHRGGLCGESILPIFIP